MNLRNQVSFCGLRGFLRQSEFSSDDNSILLNNSNKSLLIYVFIYFLTRNVAGPWLSINLWQKFSLFGFSSWTDDVLKQTEPLLSSFCSADESVEMSLCVRLQQTKVSSEAFELCLIKNVLLKHKSVTPTIKIKLHLVHSCVATIIVVKVFL